LTWPNHDNGDMAKVVPKGLRMSVRRTNMKYLAATAIVFTIISSPAFADDRSSLDRWPAIETTTLANFTGSQKHNRCPRFKVIEEATRAELAAVGMNADQLGDPSDLLRGDGTSPYVDGYNEDPSAFCIMALEKLGPNGSYKRQMLEAK
jgi:hypothetical protein